MRVFGIYLPWLLALLLFAFALGFDSGRTQKPIDELERMFFQ
jgi:hypothetical protein